MSKVRKTVLIFTGFLLLFYAFCLPRKLFRSPQSTVLEAADGTLLGARISSEGQWYFPPADNVPEKFADCIICYEDKRFRHHPGIDPLSAARAIRQNLRSRKVVSGASTITMQVIRLSRPDAPRNMLEKMYEALLATRLELRCSKDEILLTYASNAPFGGNVIGLEAAAWRYFGRPSDELSWAESAMLAVLPNAPALIHPGRNRETLRRKRDFLLDKLMEAGKIDALECELAKDEPLPDKPLVMPDEAHHLLERSRSRKGSIVHSTLDASLQQRVASIAEVHSMEYGTNMVDNMGILVADVHDGRILAYYGNNRGAGVRGSEVDMIPAARSSGSTLKPLLYAAMLQSGKILPGTLVKDTPYNYNNFSPHNFDRSFDGAVPASEVIQRSLNVPSVRMLEDYGAPQFLDLLHALGFSTITKDADHYGLSLILGGAEISLENLVRAYYYIAAKLLDEPVSRSLVWRSDARPELLDAGSDIPLGKGAIYLMLNALSDANRPEEEASWMNTSSSARIAWKTGTSWGCRDAWSVGVSRDYVVGVWVGNSNGEGRAGMTGVAYAAPVMFDVFAALPHSGWFDLPAGDLTRMEVCHESGLPASDICPHRDTVWVPDIAARPERCSYHRLVHLDEDGHFLVNSGCYPVEKMRSEVRFVLPPAMEWYYQRKHLDYCPLPPKHPGFDAAASSGSNPIAIIYPQPGVTIVATRGLDGQTRGAVCKAAHTDPSATIFWHLDDEYLGQTTGDHEMMIAPAPGVHRLVLMDSQGSSRSVLFYGK